MGWKEYSKVEKSYPLVIKLFASVLSLGVLRQISKAQIMPLGSQYM
jgi:hypothetical protein